MKKLSIGIVGLPNVGKSTLFKLLTDVEVNIANYPFCTIDPNIGVVSVPDRRIEKLSALSGSAKKIPAVVEFCDIAGLVKGAAAGEGLGNKFLSHIRDVSATLMVLRCFGGTEIMHVEDSVNPLRDMDIINAELALKDLETVEKRLETARGDMKSGKKEAAGTVATLEKVRERLLRGESVVAFAEDADVKGLQLLTAKRQMYLLNGEDSDIPQNLKDRLAELGASYVVADLSAGDAEGALDRLIREAYRILKLISFFTTGPEETRAWTIEAGSVAPQAAGTIHTDFEKKFIRAETVASEKLLEAGGWVQAKSKGWVRLEGKEYIVADGDVMVIRHG